MLDEEILNKIDIYLNDKILLTNKTQIFCEYIRKNFGLDNKEFLNIFKNVIKHYENNL